MLSDQGADLVMGEIVYLTKALSDPSTYHIDKATANAMLNHLTELHRLRDYKAFRELDELLGPNVSTAIKLWEMQ